MILEFTTKIDRNGNKYYLGIDTDRKIFACTSRHWYSVSEFINITRTDRRKILDQLKNEGYTEQHTL